MPIGGLVRLIAKAGAEEELLQRALEIADDVRSEPGNVLTLVLREPDNPGEVFMLELFRDESSIEAHRSAQHTIEKGPRVHALLKTPMEIQRLESVGKLR